MRRKESIACGDRRKEDLEGLRSCLGCVCLGASRARKAEPSLKQLCAQHSGLCWCGAWPEPGSASTPAQGWPIRASQRIQAQSPRTGLPELLLTVTLGKEKFSAAVAKLTSPGAHSMEKVIPKGKSGRRKAEPRAGGRARLMKVRPVSRPQ